jgi:hypothetical protein
MVSQETLAVGCWLFTQYLWLLADAGEMQSFAYSAIDSYIFPAVAEMMAAMVNSRSLTKYTLRESAVVHVENNL